MSLKRTAYPLSSSLLLLAFLSVSPALQAVDTYDESKEVTSLLSQTKTQMALLQIAVSEMESFSRSRLTGESHTAKLTEIKGDTLRVLETVNRLNRARDTASFSQRQKIDAINPILRDLAANIQATISHLNENRQNIEWCVQNDPDYKEHLTLNAQLTGELVKALTD